MKLQSAGEARFGLTAFHFTRAGRRRHHDPEKHARVCYGVEQWRFDGRVGRGKKWLRFVRVFDACERAGFRPV